jgi:Protein of unknown function, DUF547
MSAPLVTAATLHRRAPLAALALVLVALVIGTRPAHAAAPDASGYATLLQRYLRVIGGKGEPFDTRFDYEQFYIDEHLYTQHRSDRLDAVRGQLLSVSPSALTPRERRAWAINAYNFMVIERMTSNLLVPGRKFLRYDSPREVNRAEGTFYAAPVVTLDGVEYSLAGFARRFVYGDTTALPLADIIEARTEPADPRLMFALAHGTLGSAPLLPWVYRADSLEAQLDRATRLALALPAWLRIDPASGTFSASNHFFHERADYGGPDLPGVMPLVDRFGPPAVKKLVAKRRLQRPDMYFEPTWKLNQYEHPKPKLPGLAGADSTKTLRHP